MSRPLNEHTGHAYAPGYAPQTDDLRPWEAFLELLAVAEPLLRIFAPALFSMIILVAMRYHLAQRKKKQKIAALQARYAPKARPVADEEADEAEVARLASLRPSDWPERA